MTRREKLQASASDIKYGPAGWHWADYCEEPDECRLHHVHGLSCRCADCCAAAED